MCSFCLAGLYVHMPAAGGVIFVVNNGLQPSLSVLVGNVSLVVSTHVYVVQAPPGKSTSKEANL
jgi:hypothetical protein